HTRSKRDWSSDVCSSDLWTSQFSEVWTFAEAPLPPGVDRRDLGIDLVAADIVSGGLCAIQCKFFERDHAVSKAEIDSFFAASGKIGRASCRESRKKAVKG